MDFPLINLMIVFFASLLFSQANAGGASNITNNETTSASTTSAMNATSIIISSKPTNETSTKTMGHNSSKPTNETSTKTMGHNSSKLTNETSTKTNMGHIKFNDNSGLLQRSLYVAVGISVIVAIYFIVRSVKSKGRRKAKKYGVIRSAGEPELQPLDEGDEEDEDMTLFDKKTAKWPK